MDELVLRKVVANVADAATLAALACTCRLLRRLAAEELAERGHCRELRRLLGVAAEPAASARAAALLDGAFRWRFLSDLAAAQARAACWDARRQTPDLMSLPGAGRWLASVQLAATDLQAVLLYDRSLALLGALAFVDRPAGLQRGGGGQLPRSFFATLSTLLFKCPLRHGLFVLEPPLRLGAADMLLRQQLRPEAREALAAAAAARGCGSAGAAGHEDAHLVRSSLLRTQLLQGASMLGGCLCGALDDALVRQVATHTGPLPLRFLDIGGVDGLSDAGIAALLALCPNLRVLHAASSKLGSASLAALAGRQQAATAASAAAEAPDQGRQRSPRQRQPSSRGSGCAAAAAEELAGLRLSPGHPAQATHAATAAAASAEAEAAAAPQAACPLLERLDLSGCRRVKGSALRRALRCLPRLADLRLNACAGLSSVLDPLLDWMPAGAGGCCSAATAGSAAAAASGKAAVAAALLGGLTRLEATDADDLSAAHAAALLRCCTSLRRLALSGKQLAGERADRAKYPAAAAGSSGGSGDGTGTPSPSLVHLEVGWGSGGTLLLHLASRHGRHLASLVVHPGAAVSDDLLRSLTASCRHLARLSLKCANVSDAGVAAVLQGCTQLTSLQLLGCTGPLTDALGASLRSGGGGAQRAPFRLRELQVAWGAGQLTNAGLATLLHPSCAALQVLVLKGCSRLTDGAWAAVGQQAGTLECLQLEHCGALAAQAKRGAGSGSSSSCHEPMTASAALGALAACSRLLALTLRGCTPPWSSAQVARLQEACTALQSLDLEVE